MQILWFVSKVSDLHKTTVLCFKIYKAWWRKTVHVVLLLGCLWMCYRQTIDIYMYMTGVYRGKFEWNRVSEFYHTCSELLTLFSWKLKPNWYCKLVNVSEEYVSNMQMTNFFIPKSQIDVGQLGEDIFGLNSICKNFIIIFTIDRNRCCMGIRNYILNVDIAMCMKCCWYKTEMERESTSGSLIAVFLKNCFETFVSA